MKSIKNKLLFGFKFEKESTVYEKLGVRIFKRFVPIGDYWIRLFNIVFSKNFRLLKSKENAIVWVLFTIAVEFLHLVGFVVMTWLAFFI